MKTPIHLIIDDGSPFGGVDPGYLERFCDIVDRHGMKGDYSIIPMKHDGADIVNGGPSVDMAYIQNWLDTVKTRLTGKFDFCPEMLTHSYALDLTTGKFLEQNEHDWSQTQDRTTLTPYITKALELHKAAGIDATGVTSPWAFGIDVEEEYIAALIAAQKAVYDRDLSWYFLHVLPDKPELRPWIAGKDGDKVLVSIPATVGDIFAECEAEETSEEFINGVADKFITCDGKDGAIIRVLDAGGWPILLAHWWSLNSGGRETGLKVLDIVGRRVNELLGDKVIWMNAMELAELTV